MPAAEALTAAPPLRTNRRFLALMLTQSLGMVARGIYAVALPLFVLERTRSAFSMSVSLFLYFSPFVIAGPFVGSLVDRFSRRDLILLTNLLYGVLLFLLPLADAPLPIYLIAFAASLNGVVLANAIVALLPDIIEATQLAKANSIYTFLRSAAYLVSTGSAYFLIQALGKSKVFFLSSAILMVCGAACLAIARDRPQRSRKTRPDAPASFLKGVAGAFKIIRGDRHVRGLTLMHLLFMPIFGAFEVLLPLFSDHRLGQANYYTLLSAALGAGLALGSLFTYRILEMVRPLSLVLASFLGYSAGVFLLSRTGTLWTSILACLLMGIVDAFGFTTYEYLRQRMVPSTYRGRVFAIMDALVLLPLPLGYLGMGYFGERTEIISLATGLSVAGLLVALLCIPFTVGLPKGSGPSS